jgi:hypothetical protein
MKRVTFLIITAISILCLNFNTPEPTIGGNIKQAVNFYGTLFTHQGEEYKVDNISIDGKYKQITMYDTPRQPSKPVLNPETKQKEIILKVNPKNNFITSKLDLNEIAEIQVPNPTILWVYKKNGKGRRLEFLEVTIVSNNNKKTKNSYLLSSDTKIQCDGINAGSIEKTIPPSAIKKLVIEGYSLRDAMETKSKKQQDKNSL